MAGVSSLPEEHNLPVLFQFNQPTHNVAVFRGAQLKAAIANGLVKGFPGQADGRTGKALGLGRPLAVKAAPVIARPATIVRPAPVVIRPAPVIAKPPPVIVKPRPVIAAPAPVVVKPAPAIYRPTPVYKPTPTYVEPLYTDVSVPTYIRNHHVIT